MILTRSVLAIVLSVAFSVSAPAQAEIVGEAYFSPHFGGSDFTDTLGPYKHQRSWSFFWNTGYSIGTRVSISGDVGALGLGGEFGWKEEKLDRWGTGSLDSYTVQMSRFMVGPHATFRIIKGGIVHFYFGWDPMVYSTVLYTRTDGPNPFKKDDTLKGQCYTFGVGIDKDPVLFRILGRKIIYNDVEFEGTQHDLPDSTYSVLTTHEVVLQIGSTF